MSTSPQGDRDAKLQLLLSEYEQLREDERGLTAIQAGVLSVAVTILAAIPLALQQTCGFQGRGFAPDLSTLKDAPCTVVTNVWIIAAVPIVPLAVIAFVMALGIVSVFRSYYMRSVEEELQRSSFSGSETRGGFVPMSYMSSLNEITSFRRGAFGFKFTIGVIVLAVLVAFGGLTVYVASNIPNPYRLTMSIIMGISIILLLTEQFRIVFSGRSIFDSARDRYFRHRKLQDNPETEPMPPNKKRRSLASYLILPRLDDVFKIFIAPILLLVLWVFHSREVNLEVFISIWLPFELLIYQARYQWNDIRGLVGDIAHPERARKTRLPAGTTRDSQAAAVRRSWLVIVVRIALSQALAFFFGFEYWQIISVLTLVVFASAAVYEYLRGLDYPRSLAGRSGLGAACGIWATVTIGYLIRALLPFFAFDSLPSLVPGVSYALSVMALGFMMVSMIWAMEAASFCSTTPTWCAGPGLLTRPHLMHLLKMTRHRPTKVGVSDGTGGGVRVLEDGVVLYSIWNVCGLLACFFATIAFLLMSGFGSGAAALMAILVALGWLVLCLAPTWRYQLLVLMVFAVILVGIWWVLPLDEGRNYRLLAAMVGPLTIVGLAYINFRNASYSTMLDGFGPVLEILGKIAKKSWLKMARLATGKAVWDRLFDGGKV